MIKIDKNIPIPSKKHRNTKYPFGDMDIGDSFYVESTYDLVRPAACQYGRRHNKKFTSAKEKNGYRVLRTK